MPTLRIVRPGELLGVTEREVDEDEARIVVMLVDNWRERGIKPPEIDQVAGLSEIDPKTVQLVTASIAEGASKMMTLIAVELEGVRTDDAVDAGWLQATDQVAIPDQFMATAHSVFKAGWIKAVGELYVRLAALVDRYSVRNDGGAT